MKRNALGRGLDALLPEQTIVEDTRASRQLVEIDIDRIRPNARQPRERFEDSALDEIAQSLRQHGVLQPVVVRTVTDGYELIAGERRWRGAQRAGLSRLPAVIREASAQEALELALIENLHRQDLNPIEEARAYSVLIEEMGLTQDEVASRVGRDRSTIANYLRLLRLPGEVQAYLVRGDLSMGHARALLGLDGIETQRSLAAEAVARGWSVRQVEARVRRQHQRPASRAATKDPDVAAAEERLGRTLGTRVSIHGKERGRIEIRFSSLEELDRLYELIASSARREA